MIGAIFGSDDPARVLALMAETHGHQALTAATGVYGVLTDPDVDPRDVPEDVPAYLAGRADLDATIAAHYARIAWRFALASVMLAHAPDDPAA